MFATRDEIVEKAQREGYAVTTQSHNEMLVGAIIDLYSDKETFSVFIWFFEMIPSGQRHVKGTILSSYLLPASNEVRQEATVFIEEKDVEGFFEEDEKSGFLRVC